MIADYHIHTALCKHATGSISDYVAVAAEKGLPQICFTDHAPAPCGYDAGNRMALDQFAVYARQISDAQDSGSPEVLFGIEADYYDGCEEFLAAWLPEQDFDLALGSIHYIRNWGFDNAAEKHVWDEVDVTATWREYFTRLGKLADTRLFDVIGHIDVPKKFAYRPKETHIKDMLQPALDKIADAGMGIEINTAGLRKPVGEIYPSLSLLTLARQRDIPICFGSDAHTPGDVGFAFDRALALAKAAGYTHSLKFRKRQRESVPLP